jgi:hypothetical protein
MATVHGVLVYMEVRVEIRGVTDLIQNMYARIWFPLLHRWRWTATKARPLFFADRHPQNYLSRLVLSNVIMDGALSMAGSFFFVPLEPVLNTRKPSAETL